MATALTPYQRRLFLLLGVATFFEGYDFIALAQILPNLRADLGLSRFGAGVLFAVVNAGTVVAWPLVRVADRWGRKRVLVITIGGYTAATLLSGMAPDVYTFGAAQFLARVFLIGEWAVSMVYAAEAFPADRRGNVIGVLQAFSSLGAIVCAGVTPLLLQADWGWRTVYFVGVIPLFLLAWARRGLQETERFEQLQREGAADAPRRSPFAIFQGPHRKRVLQLGLIWFLTYACSNTAISFWKEFAVGDRGFTDGQVGASLTIAAVVSLPLVFGAGKLIDRLGRRPGAVIIFLTTIAGVWLAYTLEGRWPLTAALTLGVFGVSAVLPVLNAFNTELFPTERRGEAFAWSNNVLGRPGYVLAPLIVGYVAETHGWGPAVGPTVLGPLVALGLILLWLPETAGKELEEVAGR